MMANTTGENWKIEGPSGWQRTAMGHKGMTSHALGARWTGRSSLGGNAKNLHAQGTCGPCGYTYREEDGRQESRESPAVSSGRLKTTLRVEWAEASTQANRRAES